MRANSVIAYALVSMVVMAALFVIGNEFDRHLEWIVELQVQQTEFEKQQGAKRRLEDVEKFIRTMCLDGMKHACPLLAPVKRDGG